MESADWADMKRLRILIEEVGEVAKCFNEWDLGHLTTSEAMEEVRAELIQVTAMAGAWADVIFVGVDKRPHSRACGWRIHGHGPACHPNCPTCGRAS